MKKQLFLLSLTSLLGTTTMHAQDLSFTSGVVSNYNTVYLTLKGPTNLVVQVERLNRTNDVWESQGITTLNSSGNGSFTSSLIEGIYGFFRTKATNNTYYSTNAFGAVCGYLPNNLSIVGNIFGTQSITNILPSPANGMQAYKWNNASGSYTAISWFDALHSWNPGPFNVEPMEAIFIRNPQTNQLRYIVSGLFTTNAISKDLPTGLSLISSQRYHIIATNSWQVDLLSTNHLGGLSAIPVQTLGYDPQAEIYQAIDNIETYSTNTLTSGNMWLSGGTNTTIGINITEGFWLDKPTNATWVITRPIW
jgi:hypothetical protein